MDISQFASDNLHIMDGSISEDQMLKNQLVKKGILIPLPKYENCYLARTDPKVRKHKHTLIPHPSAWTKNFVRS